MYAEDRLGHGEEAIGVLETIFKSHFTFIMRECIEIIPCVFRVTLAFIALPVKACADRIPAPEAP